MTMKEFHNNSSGQYKRLPKSIRQHYSGMVSYCCHTHVKLVSSNQFVNTAISGTAVASEHPVFSVPTPKILETLMTEKQLSWTEQYLLTTAIMVKTGMVITTGIGCCGLYMTENDFNKYRDTLLSMLQKYGPQLVSRDMALPRYRVTVDNASDGKAVKQLLLNTREVIHDTLLEEQLSTVTRRNDSEQMTQIDLERELQGMLQNYGKVQRYSPQLGKWAVRQLRAAEVPQPQVAMVQFCLSADDNKLRRELLKEAIELVRNNLEFIDEQTRTKSSLVLRHLQHRLETLYKEEEELGFVVLEDDLTTSRGTGNKYSTRTKVVDDIPVNKEAVAAVNKVDVDSISDPVQRMKARMAAYASAKSSSNSNNSSNVTNKGDSSNG